MNGRKLNTKERLIRENILNERYALHHIQFELVKASPRNFIRKRPKGDEVIAIPQELHNLLKMNSPYIPSDYSAFFHDFMMVQIIAQLYDGFDDLFWCMVYFDDFDSYNKDYKFWKKYDKEKDEIKFYTDGWI